MRSEKKRAMALNKIRLIILVAALFPAFGNLRAQKVLTLSECYDAAYAKSALSSGNDILNEISGLRESNISKAWMPTLDLNGTALYNSDVVDLGPVFGNLPFPGVSELIKPLPHDQYKITIDVNQVIYDGGAVRAARESERADLRLNEKQTEADLYKIRQQVNTYFFNIRLLERQKDLLGIYLELLQKRMTTVNSAVENGVMLRSEAEILESEMISLQQQLSENEIRSSALRKVLADLTGIDIADGTVLVIPDAEIQPDDKIDRPETGLIDMSIARLDAAGAVVASKRRPRAFGFATLGYGNPPGSNFFMDEFDTFYILGAGFKWNIFDWNSAKNDKRIISLNKNLLENKKTDLTENLRRQAEMKKAEIENLEKLIGSDSIQVSLRKRITASAESQFRNGTITATEYLNILSSERQALVNSEIHLISLALARVEYMNITGKELN